MQNGRSLTIHEQKLNSLLDRVETDAPSDYAKLHILALPKNRSALSYFELGDPNGRPLLCLHGLSVTGLFFEQYNDYFVELGVRAIAPCLLGGIYVPDSGKNIETLTSELLELLDLLGVETFDVMGFSWGTLPQLSLLARAPERIGKAGLLGPMAPVKFVTEQHIGELKSDVRLTLKMVERMPFVHRCLMALVCSLPVASLIGQFKDDNLSPQESAALEPAHSFYNYFARCMDECRRTGSQFFTHAWRMFLDQPGYGLADFRRVAACVDVHLYVAENDNVHLPYFSALIAAACSGAEVSEVARAMNQTGTGNGKAELFKPVYAHKQCSVWMTEGAGRLACALYFKEALQHLMLDDSSGNARRCPG